MKRTPYGAHATRATHVAQQAMSPINTEHPMSSMSSISPTAPLSYVPPAAYKPLSLCVAAALAVLCASSAQAQQADPFNPAYNPVPREPNAPALVRGNSNLGTPGLTDSLLSYGAAALVKRVEVTTEQVSVPADSRSLVRITVKLLDQDDKPVTAEIPVLLEASRGRIVSPGQGNTALEASIDRDRTAPGTQVMAKQGEFSFDLVAPGEPGEALVRVSVGPRQQTLKLNFVPDLREMIAVGLIEGVISLNKQSGGIRPTRPSDGFEQEILRWQRAFKDHDGSYGLRTAFFLKGKISGASLLSAAYDSDKDVRGRLFRDIRAEEFYPVYGDASIRGADAQTSGRFFVRVDNDKSYALYGDFNTSEQINDALQLGRYNRSLTGAKGHWETDNVNLTAFASKDSLRQVVDELPANRLSGPYTTKYPNGIQNTEKVELVVRDRNAPAVILRVTPLVRDLDYGFEPFSGSLLLKSAVTSVDESLNPVSIRISYEVEEGGPQYWVGGVEGSVKLGDKVTLGASAVKDHNPLAKYQLADINAQLKLGERTRVLAEVARSDRGEVIEFGSATAVANTPTGSPSTLTAAAAKGNAWRVELQHQADSAEGRLYAQKADTGFSNPSSSTLAGRQEVGGKLTLAATNAVRFVGEVVQSKDLTTQGKRQGESLSAIWDIVPQATVEIGVRHADQTGAGATVYAVPVTPGLARDPVTGGFVTDPNASATGANLNAAYKSTSARLKATWRPTSASSVFVEAEQDLDKHSAHAYAVGGDYRFSEVGRVYGRSETATGLSGAYGLAGEGKQSSTVIGVDAQYMKDGQVFNEYRLRDGLSGRDAVAAVGLRNYWTVAEGVRLNTTVERIKALANTNTTTTTTTNNATTNATSSPESKAAGIGIDYTRSELWKGSARLEWRDDNFSTTKLSTLAAARKLSEDWTLLARNYWYRQDFDNGDKHHQERFQLGAAWRSTQTNEWSALGKYEYRDEQALTQATPFTRATDTRAKVNLFSVDVSYHPSRPLWYAGKVAAKQRKDILEGSPDDFKGQLLQGRVIYDLTSRWDAGLIVSRLHDATQSKNGVGVELGRIMTDNLWLSLGYNFIELKDKDLAGDYASKGVFLKLRYKFDENLFKSGKPGLDKSVLPEGAN
jgi:hypothetical protein